MRLLSPLAAALLAAAAPARADSVATTTTNLSLSVGTSAAACIPANPGRRTLFIENPAGNTVNLGYCVGAGCTPALTPTAGTSVLQPGQSDFWPAGTAPQEAIACIAGGAATPVTIRSGQ